MVKADNCSSPKTAAVPRIYCFLLQIISSVCLPKSTETKKRAGAGGGGGGGSEGTFEAMEYLNCSYEHGKYSP